MPTFTDYSPTFTSGTITRTLTDIHVRGYVVGGNITLPTTGDAQISMSVQSSDTSHPQYVPGFTTPGGAKTVPRSLVTTGGVPDLVLLDAEGAYEANCLASLVDGRP